MQNSGLLRIYNILYVTVLLIFLNGGCKKTEESLPPEATPLMTLDFTDDYVNPQLGAIAFISTMQGDLLADTAFIGNKRITLYPMAGKTVPGTFIVTIATWEPDMHNFTISMHSWMYIAPSSWRLKGDRLETAGQITVSLANVPAHTGPVLFANRGFSNLTFNTTARVNDLFAPDDDLYIRVNTAGGPRFVWQNGVVPGGVYTVDMTTTDVAETKTITFPATAVYYEARLYGYRSTDYETTLSTQSDEILGDGTPAGSVTVSFPPSIYQGYRTELKYIEDWGGLNTWFYHVNGEIPGAFRKTDATVISAAPSVTPPGLSLTSSGTFTLASATWQFSASNNQNFIWTISGPDTTTKILLPKLPPSMAKMFPVLALDSLTYSHVELANYFLYPSYNPFIGACFDPVHPLSPTNMEASSVRVVNGKKQ